MKKFNLLLVITSLLVLFACEETAMDVSDSDSRGEFSITVDGQTYTGETVENGVVLGTRFISAETVDFTFSCLITETDFIKGKVFEIGNEDDQLMPYLLLGDEENAEVMFFYSGTLTVVSTTKIEFEAYLWDFTSDLEATIPVTGYVSSK